MIKTRRNSIVDIEENEILLLMYFNIIQQNIYYTIQLEDCRNQMEADILEKQKQYKARQMAFLVEFYVKNKDRLNEKLS